MSAQLAQALDRAETAEVRAGNLEEELSRRIGRVTKLEAQLEAVGNELQAYKNEVAAQRAQESAQGNAHELEKERLREELRKLERDRDVQLGLVQNRTKQELAKLEADLATERAKLAQAEALAKHHEELARLAEAEAAEAKSAQPTDTGISEEAAAHIQSLEEQIAELTQQMEELVAETGELSAAETIAMSRAARAKFAGGSRATSRQPWRGGERGGANRGLG